MFNRTEIIGRLGQNATLRRIDSGSAVANFSVATSEQWKDKSGEKQERTQWFRVVLWGKVAEVLEPYLTKGKLVFVAGKMQSREFQTKDGQTATSWELNAQEVKLLSMGGARDEHDQRSHREEDHHDQSGAFDDDMPI